MGILNFLKKPSPKKVKKAVKEKVPEKKAEAPLKAVPLKEKKIGAGWRVLKAPHISEKAGDLVDKNQYVFEVWPETNKTEIKKAVEGVYGVDVIKVKIIKVPRKKRRLGRISGFKQGYKKAIVKIKKGQKIEILPR